MTFRWPLGHKFAVPIVALTPCVLLAIGVHARAPRNLPTPRAYQSIQNFTRVGADAQFQHAIKSSTVRGAPAIFDAPTTIAAAERSNYSSAGNPMTGFGVDGRVNPVAYGADPTGVSDNSAAFDAAYTAACGINNGTVCIPAGTYKFFAPWLAMCPSTHGGYTPDIVGTGKTASTLMNYIALGGPLVELAGPTVVSSFGGAATLIQPGLTASGGNSFNWGPRATPPAALFNLDQVLGDQVLNGKSQLDIRVIFNTTTNSAVEYMVSSDGGAAPQKEGCNFIGPNASWTCKGAVSISLGSDGKLYGSINTSITGWTGSSALRSASAVGTGANLLAELSYDGSNVRLFHGTLGGTSTMDAKFAQTGTLKQRTDENLVVGAIPRYWSMVEPTSFWQGKIDSVQISGVAGCTNDRGCSIPNAKLKFDGNTILGENWSNVSNLPLVEPEYVTGTATDQKTKQAWMAMYNEGLGNSAGNQPTIRDFGIGGGMVGMHVNVVSPHIERLNLAVGSAVPKYGIMLDLPSDYSSTVDNVVMSNGVIPIVDEGGIDALTRLSLTCGIACIELVGSSVRDALLLPPSSTQWGIILSSPVTLDDIILDTENGGAFTVIQASNMNRNRLPGFGLTNSFIAAWGAGQAPITLDGLYGRINIGTAELAHGTGVAGPMINVANGRQTIATGIIFENNSYDGHAEPSDTAGDSYVSATDNLGAPVTYAVVGGGSTRQTTLTGTSAGTFVWSMPGEGSSSKKFVGHYTGYENATMTAQTVTYPVAFALTPKITSNDASSGSTSTSVLTLPASMGSKVTGWIIVEGY
jgi:hypothetical protein